MLTWINLHVAIKINLENRFISVLCILDIEANTFYDRSNQLCSVAFLTRGYTQYALRL